MHVGFFFAAAGFFNSDMALLVLRGTKSFGHSKKGSGLSVLGSASGVSGFQGSRYVCVWQPCVQGCSRQQLCTYPSRDREGRAAIPANEDSPLYP